MLNKSLSIQNQKLRTLLELEGYDPDDPMEALEDWTYDSTVPGICKNPNCDYIAHYESDQSRGWCEECSANTVVSGLILAGIM